MFVVKQKNNFKKQLTNAKIRGMIILSFKDDDLSFVDIDHPFCRKYLLNDYGRCYRWYDTLFIALPGSACFPGT